MLQHALARQAPREPARAAMYVEAAAVSNMQHKELGALANLRVLGTVVHPCAGTCKVISNVSIVSIDD